MRLLFINSAWTVAALIPEMRENQKKKEKGKRWTSKRKRNNLYPNRHLIVPCLLQILEFSWLWSNQNESDFQEIPFQACLEDLQDLCNLLGSIKLGV